MNLDYRKIMEAAKAYVAEEKPMVFNSDQAADLVRPILQNEPQECLWVIILNAKNKAVKIHEVTRGLLDRSQAHPREVFREAIRCNASKLIIVHNHPSGEITPSAEDIKVTSQLVEAGKIVGIPVVDHLIIGQRITGTNRDYFSFREANATTFE